MKSLSLKNTLTLNFVFVAALPLIITAFWGLYNLSNNMEREITNKNYILAKSIAGELEVILGHPLLHLKQIRYVTERKDIVSPDDLNDYFTSLIEVNRVFDMIKVLDHKGIVTHLAPFDENILGLDMSNQEYYRSSLNTDKHYWSKTFISSQTGMPTLALTLPLKQGLLVGHLNLSHLNKITDRAKISDLEDVVITDNNGVVIVHPKGELVCERFNVKHFNHIRQGLTGIEGTFKYYLEGVEKIGSVVIVPQTGWLVAISQSVDEAFEPIKKLRNFIYVSIMVAILIAILISLTNLHRILQPLSHFAEESKRIAGGDYTYKLSKASYIEIDNLNSSFKTMIDAVKTREDALRDEITERKQVEDKLIKNQYYLTKAQEIGIIGTWELDIQKNILKWTDENYKIFGVPIGTEMNYEIFLNCVHPDDKDYVHKKWSAGLNKEPYDIEHRIIVNDKVKWVREKADIEFDTEGNPVMAIGFTQEITDRKHAEETLKDKERSLAILMSNLPGMAYRCKNYKNWTMEFVSNGSYGLTGYHPSDLINNKKIAYGELIHTEDQEQVWKTVQSALSKKESFQFIYRISNIAGEEKWVWEKGCGIFSPDGELQSLEGFISDITDRKQAEEELETHREHLEELVEDRTNELKEKTDKIEKSRQALTYLLEDVNASREKLQKVNIEFAAANKELKEFAYIVSHDLKAPLRAISQLTHWISEDYSKVFNDDGKMQMDLIIKRVKRMDGLIDGILRYSRVGRIREKKERLDLNLLVNEVINNIAPPDNIQIIFEKKLPVVFRDSTRMEQVFQNLIGNAIKFMDKREGIIRVGCVDEGAFWKFSVFDNGPGIDKRYHDKIFQIFQTLVPRDEHESTGIGLTLVKKIIGLYGGSVSVGSEAGHGTTFFFTLPKKGEKYEKLQANSSG